jgi:hypothetical protein
MCRDKPEHTWPRLQNYRLSSTQGVVEISVCNGCLATKSVFTIYLSDSEEATKTVIAEP